MLKNKYISLLSFILISLIFVQNSVVSTMEPPGKTGFYTSTASTPLKKNSKPYGGYNLETSIENVPVELCASLGKSCNARMTEFIDRSDEFVVAFMYRFNSPTVINALANKYMESKMENADVPVLVFLDHSQSIGSSKYHQYIKHLIDNVPTSLIKLGSKTFHQKIIICKKKGEQAFVIVGSANATLDADNAHSEDSVIIQSNALAQIYLKEFKKLLTMKISSNALKIFHEHRLEIEKSNTDQLDILQEKLLPDDAINENFRQNSYTSSIKYLGISTGFRNGTMNCFNIFNNILNMSNQYLFLFENYLTLPEKNYPKLWKKLRNDTPKLIVIDDNKTDKEDNKNNNANSIELLKSQPQNTALLFRPYTGGKFHHKLVIQYPEEGPPVVYTGSFHPATNAIENNSENIIGIVSKELAEAYLAAILWQSNLSDRTEIWEFISKFPELYPTSSPVEKVVKKTHLKTSLNIKKYFDRFNRVVSELLSLHDLKFEGLEDYKEKFKKNFNGASINIQIDLLREGRKVIFSSKDLYSYLLDKVKLIESIEVPIFPPSPQKHLDFQEIGEWLKKVKDWIDDITMEINRKRDKKIDNINNIKLKIKEIYSIYSILWSAYDYPSSFQYLVNLDNVLSKIDTPPLAESLDLRERKRKLMGQDPAEKSLEPHKSKRKLEKKAYSYNINNLRSFLTYLKEKHSYKVISEKINRISTPQILGKIVSGNIQRLRNEQAIWSSLKENFADEFNVWSERAQQ